MRGNKTLKRVDRFIGIPLLLALGPLGRVARRRRPDGKPSIIGVLKENAIGDTVVLAAALSDLRRANPQSRIVFFAGPTNYEFARLLAVPDQVERLPIDRPLACAKILRAHRLDVLFDAGQWPRINALLCLLSGAGQTVGFATPGQYRHYGYDRIVEHRSDLHEIDNFRRLLGAGGISPMQPATFEFRYPECPPPTHRPYVVLHQWPGGERSELKEWPFENWLAVARHAAAAGRAVVLTGAPGDREKNARLVGALGAAAVFDLGGRPLRELPSLLIQSSLVVSVNTGLMHLAAVLDVPTIGLHGPTSIARWGPRGERSVAIASRDPNSQYLNLGFEYPVECKAMSRLELPEVLAAMDAILSHPEPVRR